MSLVLTLYLYNFEFQRVVIPFYLKHYWYFGRGKWFKKFEETFIPSFSLGFHFFILILFAKFDICYKNTWIIYLESSVDDGSSVTLDNAEESAEGSRKLLFYIYIISLVWNEIKWIKRWKILPSSKIMTSSCQKNQHRTMIKGWQYPSDLRKPKKPAGWIGLKHKIHVILPALTLYSHAAYCY